MTKSGSRPLSQAASLDARGLWRTWRRDVGMALLAAAVSIAGAAIVLRLWRADLGIPFRGNGDALFFQMLVKDALQHGWTLTNPSLGAPFGQELYDYPVAGADVLHVIAIKFLGLFSSNPNVVFNLYYLLSFPLAAIAAYAVLRWLRVSAAVAVAGAVLFALAPYPFLRSEYHFFLAHTFPIPLGAYLVLAIYLGRPLFAQRENARARLARFATPRTFGTLAICVAVGLSDFYYAAFTALLAGAATLIASATRRELGTLAAGAAVTLAVIATTAVVLAPSLIYRADHGGNEALSRAPSESELYSLNVIGLVMPVENHRIGGLASLRNRYQQATSVGKEPAPLGLVASIGFVWLLVVALALCLGARSRLGRDPRQRSLATANLTALLLGTTGGLSAIIAFAIGPELRTWSRLSIFIAFFAVAALCVLADAAWSSFTQRGSRARMIAVGALAAIVVAAVVEQTSPEMTPDYSQVAAEYHSDDAFVREIARSVPPGAEIFQLPYLNFPDQLDFAGIQDYDHARGYLHSDDLRWSYGAMKGRPDDWQSETVNLPMNVLLPMVSAAGFGGIYLDHFGYPGHGASAEAQLRQILNVAPVDSPNGRLSFFDMGPYNERLRAEHSPSELAALAEVTLRPLQTQWKKGSWSRDSRVAPLTTRWAEKPSARIEVVNPSSRPRVAFLTMTLARPAGTPANVRLRYPGGQQERLQVNAERTRVLRQLSFPPGNSAIEVDTLSAPVSSGVGEATPGYVQVEAFQLTPLEAREAAARE
jgi:hypothetical protein